MKHFLGALRGLECSTGSLGGKSFITARTAVLKHPSEHGETQIWAYTVLPGTQKSISDSLFRSLTSMWITIPERNQNVGWSHEDNRKVTMFWIHFGLSSSLVQVVLATAGNLNPGDQV